MSSPRMTACLKASKHTNLAQFDISNISVMENCVLGTMVELKKNRRLYLLYLH